MTSNSYETLVIDPEAAHQLHETLLNDELVSVFSEQGEQHVRTHVVDARDSSTASTIIVPRAYDARLGSDIHDLETQRDRAIALSMHARVIGVDVPGVGLNEDAKSPIGQTLKAFGGNVDQLSEAQMRAAIQAGELQNGDEISFLGYSMGAWATAKSIELMHTGRLPVKLQLAGVALVEAVNDRNWSLIGNNGLLARIGEETNPENTNRYLAYNDTFGFAQPRDRQPGNYTQTRKVDGGKGGMTTLGLGAGMRKGFAEPLAKVWREHKSELADVPVVIARTNGSTVARRDANMSTMGALLNAGSNEVSFMEFRPGEDEDPHRHPFWHSIAHAALASTIISRRISS